VAFVGVATPLFGVLWRTSASGPLLAIMALVSPTSVLRRVAACPAKVALAATAHLLSSTVSTVATMAAAHLAASTAHVAHWR